MPSRFFLPAFLLAVLAALAMACTSQDAGDAPQGPSELLGEAYDALQQDYVLKDQLTDDRLSTGAIRGMLETLDDPYTAYLDPDQMQLHGDFSGHFGGIGAQVEIRNGQFTIVATLPDSPASRAGIGPGDLVLSADGESLAGKPLLEAVLLIRGPKGTEVTLEIVHEGEITPITVTVVRDTIVPQSVLWRMLEPGIGYVRLTEFVETTHPQLKQALEQITAQETHGLVLDLRNNGGGLLSSAIDVASEFLEDGVLLSSVDSEDKETEHHLLPGGAATDIPMVVLVNGNSASAAEVVAGAIQDHRRGVLVGTRTFGKGSVTLIVPLSNGGGLNVTTARWFTPSGRLLEGNGLDPDVPVGNGELLPATEAVEHLFTLLPELCAAFPGAKPDIREPSLVEQLEQLCSLPALPHTHETGAPDVQLDRAVQVLKEQM